MNYTYSKIKDFLNCPMLFKFKHKDFIKKYFQGVEAFTGNMTHDALKLLYEDNLDLSSLLDHYNTLWQDQWNDEIKIVRKNKTFSYYKELGEKCLIKYYEHYYMNDFNAFPIFLEKSLSTKINGYTLKGRIDRISISNHKKIIHICDYKTGKLPPPKVIENDFQLPLYSIMFRDNFGDFPIETRLIYLQTYKVFVKNLTDQDYNYYTSLISDQIEKIESTEKFEKRQSGLCPWCAFRDLCNKEDEEN